MSLDLSWSSIYTDARVGPGFHKYFFSDSTYRDNHLKICVEHMEVDMVISDSTVSVDRVWKFEINA